MLSKLRKSLSSNFFLAAAIACLFLLAKSKTPKPAPTLKPAAKATQAPKETPVKEELTVSVPQKPERKFSRQLNRHRKQVVAEVKKAQKISKPKKKLAKKSKPIKRAQMARLNEIAETGLSESPQGAAFSLDPYESETLLDPMFSLAALFPREAPLTIHEGVLVAQDYTALWETLNTFSDAPKLAPQYKEPQPQPKTEPAREVAKSSPKIESAVAEKSEVEPEEPEDVATPVTSQNLKPLQAAPAEIETAIQAGKNILQKIEKTFAPAPSTAPVSRTTSVTTQNQRIEGPVGNLFGKFSMDSQVQEWLDQSAGHVELKLQRSDSRDPQDRIYLEYQYPEQEFSWDGQGISGSYQLVASIFKANKSVPIAEVIYPTELNSETAKRRVIFHIRKPDLDEALRSVAARNQKGVVLSGTVFEASTADTASEKTISAAEVEVIGFPQLGLFRTAKDGTFRIPNISSQSEFVLQVKAEGYYPTQVIVPVFQTTGYVSVHLVSKSTVDTVTRFFTKKPQAEQKSLIVGRVFDPQTRAPQSDQELTLLGRSSSALYFNAFPDTSLRKTTGTGSYAYFNVEPAFRSLGKMGSSAFHLIQTKPGSAYYVESGRGGSRTLHGKLIDPYRQQSVPGLVKIVGSSTQVEANEKGEFEINGIDLPPGVITFEVEAEGYPKSWHTVPWSTRDAHQSYTFYLPEADLLQEARASVARVQEIPHRGTILGGAQSKFFEHKRQCVYVSLESTSGDSVSAEQGPYPIAPTDNLSEKQLCLSPQKPGFAFYNLEPGEYILKWKTSRGELLRTHVARVGADRVSILIN